MKFKINEHGVCTNPHVENIRIGEHYYIKIKCAFLDQKWRGGVSLKYGFGGMHHPCCVGRLSKTYPTKESALIGEILSGVEYLEDLISSRQTLYSDRVKVNRLIKLGKTRLSKLLSSQLELF